MVPLVSLLREVLQVTQAIEWIEITDSPINVSIDCIYPVYLVKDSASQYFSSENWLVVIRVGEIPTGTGSGTHLIWYWPLNGSSSPDVGWGGRWFIYRNFAEDPVFISTLFWYLGDRCTHCEKFSENGSVRISSQCWPTRRIIPHGSVSFWIPHALKGSECPLWHPGSRGR